MEDSRTPRRVRVDACTAFPALPSSLGQTAAPLSVFHHAALLGTPLWLLSIFLRVPLNYVP